MNSTLAQYLKRCGSYKNHSLTCSLNGDSLNVVSMEIVPEWVFIFSKQSFGKHQVPEMLSSSSY